MVGGKKFLNDEWNWNLEVLCFEVEVRVSLPAADKGPTAA